MDPEKEPEKKKPKFTAINKLMDYLARRDHSEKELREKLSKNFSPDEVERAIRHAYEHNWMSPPEELAERVKLSLHRKKKGQIYINRYLQEKGLPQVSRDHEVELEKAREVLEMKFGKTGNFSFEERKKAYKYLSYRGFEHDVIKKVTYEKL